MKLQEAVVEARRIGTQLNEHAEAAGRASRTYEATMTLYNVAAEAGDEEAMQKHRDTLHTTVDVILDSGAMMAQLNKQLKTVTASVTE